MAGALEIGAVLRKAFAGRWESTPWLQGLDGEVWPSWGRGVLLPSAQDAVDGASLWGHDNEIGPVGGNGRSIPVRLPMPPAASEQKVLQGAREERERPGGEHAGGCSGSLRHRAGVAVHRHAPIGLPIISPPSSICLGAVRPAGDFAVKLVDAKASSCTGSSCTGTCQQVTDSGTLLQYGE